MTQNTLYIIIFCQVMHSTTDQILTDLILKMNTLEMVEYRL